MLRIQRGPNRAKGRCEKAPVGGRGDVPPPGEQSV